MVSNSPSIPFKWVKRAHYRDFPDDIRPSRLADLMAHVGGTTVEIIVPLVLLFSHNATGSRSSRAAVMVVFHLFITSTFPLAVPLEWNILFAYAHDLPVPRVPSVGGIRPRRHVAPVAAGRDRDRDSLFFPVLGNLRPDLVSFLPSMRQYAGNWASAVWAFAPGAEEKLNAVTRSATNTVDQYKAFGYEPRWAEIAMQQVIAWRTHAQPGPRPVLGAARAPPRHRRPHGPRGRVRLQHIDRLQLRRRPPARRRT